jgi:hypothetical protein
MKLSMLKYDVSNSIFGWDIILIGIKNFISSLFLFNQTQNKAKMKLNTRINEYQVYNDLHKKTIFTFIN